MSRHWGRGAWLTVVQTRALYKRPSDALATFGKMNRASECCFDRVEGLRAQHPFESPAVKR
ncbi:MAG: hypothetical protein GY847_35925 [Proteobacteria bacterium]|nr:hypothetical protein [Pseudomonadota bacterium]